MPVGMGSQVGSSQSDDEGMIDQSEQGTLRGNMLLLLEPDHLGQG